MPVMMRPISMMLAALALVPLGCGARTGTFDRPAPDSGPDAQPDAPELPPTVTCSPQEAWTTIGRESVIRGDGDDDGWITLWHWSVVERPPGSVVAPSPSSALVTSLTPDVEGTYVVQLTVTDDDALTADCTAVIHSIVGPPVAFCPDDIVGATVGRAYQLDGDGFDDEMIVGFSWEVSARPEGSLAEVQNAQQPVASFTPDVAGRFELTFTVTDSDGDSDSCVVVVSSSGPPHALCPEEATVPTRQPHELIGDVEDDGEAASWRWQLLNAPAGSTTSLDHPNAQTTTITPDRVGDYLIELTVTDDTGLTDSCETVVHATPTPPDAVCPDTVETTPLTEVTLRGEGEDDGEVVAWEWELIEAPASSSTPPPAPPDQQITQFMPDVAGEYRLRLTVIDDDGMEGSCETRVRAVPSEGLRVELYWNPPDSSCDAHPGPGCDDTDVDLHLLHPDAPHWFATEGVATDCFYANCIAWDDVPTLEWDAPGVADNPRQDLDDVEGFGPENINIDEPVIGHSYTVGVHFFSDHGTGQSADAHIQVYCGTIEVDPVYSVGPVTLQASGNSGTNDFWRVATVVWDGFACDITPLATAGGAPDIIAESEAQRRR